MSTPRITLRDVAEAAGVSLTAVSFYLNNRAGLSDETRVRIAEAVERLGYVPRVPSPKIAKSNFIGLLIEHLPLSPFVDMFYGDVIQGIEMQARSMGYNLALMTMEGTTSFVQLFQQHSGSLAGLIILGVGNIHPAFIETLVSEKLPAVFVDTDARELVMPSVMPDYISGAYKATQYLLAKGYQHIAFIQGSTKYRSLLERFHGYTSALADAGIPLDFALVQPSVSSGKPNKGFLEMRALLERGIHFDAVFCVTDRTALGALEALREAHVKVPNDIALLGFDNVSQVSHTSPPLTTVDVYKRELGSKAMDILSQQINSPRQVLAAKTLTPTRLVIRSST